MRRHAHSFRAASQAVFTQSLPRSWNEKTPSALAIAWCRLLAGGLDLFLDSGFGPEPVLALAVAFDLPGPRTIRACRMYERYRPVFAPYRSPLRSLRARAMQMLLDPSWKQHVPNPASSSGRREKNSASIRFRSPSETVAARASSDVANVSRYARASCHASRPSLFASRRVLRRDSVSNPSISSSLELRLNTAGGLIVFDPMRSSPPLVPSLCQSAPELPTPCPCYRSVSTAVTQTGLRMPEEFSTMKLQYYSRFGTALVHLQVAGAVR